jgi:glycosyltransferase involved in cell wall biosynthesis
MNAPLVSVVIPTYRRPRLVARAVQSALRQSLTDLEVIVVIDGNDDGTRAVVDGIGDTRTRVIEQGTNQGPAEARNRGVQEARGRYIALLDDDDEFTAEKLETQVLLIQQRRLEGGDFLVACRIIVRTKGDPRILPERLFQEGDDLSEYLLDRRSPFKRTGMIASGSLMFPRSLALRVPFPKDNVLEDYSWLLLCVIRDHVPLYMCPEPMFIYHINLESVSRHQTMDWHLSMEWGRRYRTHMTGAAFSGLLASTTVWRAKRQGGYPAFVEIAKVMKREGNPRLMHWFMLGSVALLPHNFADKLRRGMT